MSAEDAEAIAATFVIGGSRVFDQDPRFGLLVLSEIASRALSPAVNDPGWGQEAESDPRKVEPGAAPETGRR